MPFPVAFNLTPIQDQILDLLLRRDVVNKDAIRASIYGMRSNGGPPDRTITSHVCLLRDKLLQKGIVVETKIGAGYYMTATMKQRLRAAMKRMTTQTKD